MGRESGPWGWRSTGQVKRDVRHEISPATFLDLERDRNELSQYDPGAIETRPDSCCDAIGRFRHNDTYAADLLRIVSAAHVSADGRPEQLRLSPLARAD